MKTKIILGVILLCLFPYICQAQSLSLSGVGAKNRSFGGASVASPIDAAGAIHWNPAAIAGLDRSQMEIGFELLDARAELSSRVDALGASGSTDSDVNLSPIPNLAVVMKEEDSRFTYGIGFLGVAGFRVNYPSSATNPILTPQPSGIGRLIGEAEVFQIVPTIAYDVTDNLTIGFAPTLSIARLQADPLFLASPNSDGTYGPGADSDHHYGGGFQVGVFYEVNEELQLGASFKSPQYFEDFKINSATETGLPRQESLDIDYPLIASLGLGYQPTEQWLLGVDVRYFDWGNTDGFEQSGFDSTGAVSGFGWDNIFSIATGLQYQASEKVSLRLGYNFTENPIADSQTFFNVASPLIVEHIASFGITGSITQDVDLSFAFLYGFENTVSGPIINPIAGAVPGTEVKSEVSAIGYAGGVTVRFN